MKIDTNCIWFQSANVRELDLSATEEWRRSGGPGARPIYWWRQAVQPVRHQSFLAAESCTVEARWSAGERTSAASPLVRSVGFARPGSVGRSLARLVWDDDVPLLQQLLLLLLLLFWQSSSQSCHRSLFVWTPPSVIWLWMEAESWKATGELAEMQNTYVALPLRWRQLKEQYDYNPLEIVVLNTEIPIECLLLFWLFALLAYSDINVLFIKLYTAVTWEAGRGRRLERPLGTFIQQKSCWMMAVCYTISVCLICGSDFQTGVIDSALVLTWSNLTVEFGLLIGCCLVVALGRLAAQDCLPHQQ